MAIWYQFTKFSQSLWRGRPAMVFSCVGLIVKFIAVVGVTLSISVARASVTPKRVIVLQSNGQDFKPWSDYVRTFRQELEQQSSLPMVIQHFPVALGPGGEGAERQLSAYLDRLFSGGTPDLLVAFGAPAAAFLQRHRTELFPTVPALLAAIDERRVQQMRLTGNDAVVAVWIDIPSLFENIVRVLPETKNVAVVIGNSSNEGFWVDEIRSRLQPMKERINLLFWNELSFEEILKRAAVLPKDSAIFWIQPQVDVTGATHDGEQALKRLHAVANAPIFSHDDAFFGDAIVGGRMTSVLQGSRAAAAVAVKILGGEKAGEIKTPALLYEAAKYDWRELKRWGIPEGRLPEGSKVLFRQPSAWELYRWQVLAVCSALLIQTTLIFRLLFEKRGRVLAEVQARQRSSELAHINRFSMAGELTATIAHELNQPLGAILTNVETAELIVKSPVIDPKQIGEILADIRRDDMRAADVIGRLRTLIKRTPFELKDVDLNDTARETVQFLSALAVGREVELISLVAPMPLSVQGDPIQLQQVVLNLIVNAMDAMSGMPSTERRIKVSTSRDGSSACLSVSDVGPGIPADQLKQVFEPFFTTKPKGMGMGLSIARTIVETHSGQISAENLAGRGAAFHITLPLAKQPK
ncbi:sensor histidine kinase [Bradyrhizobium sp. 6(2017)]|uniref:sensor histidine kinase n=1 Tax=Bradyrhizobium sp. 6(2017) TaxID=1197460 RepID=UPI001FEE0555|nr:sensor histidine kinase [Bradyrhizobium sp. 6(2017)]